VLQALSSVPADFSVQLLLSKALRGSFSCSLSKVAALSALAQQQHEDDPSSATGNERKDMHTKTIQNHTKEYSGKCRQVTCKAERTHGKWRL
jgi:hypothetical protein